MCTWSGGDEPDPAVGSSGVSGKQGRFDGSDRQARGRLMKALSGGPVEVSDIAGIMQRNEDVAARLVDDLIADGLCQSDRLTVRLPD